MAVIGIASVRQLPPSLAIASLFLPNFTSGLNTAPKCPILRSNNKKGSKVFSGGI